MCIIIQRHHCILVEVADRTIERLSAEDARAGDHGAESDVELVREVGGVTEPREDHAVFVDI
jgi:hypothetical protein